MYQETMQQITNDRINGARQMAAAHRQAKAAKESNATGPNRATRIATQASKWLAALTERMSRRPVFDSNAS